MKTNLKKFKIYPPKKFKNHNLHQTVKKPSWWKDQIEKYAEVIQQDELWLGKWK